MSGIINDNIVKKIIYTIIYIERKSKNETTFSKNI